MNYWGPVRSTQLCYSGYRENIKHFWRGLTENIQPNSAKLSQGVTMLISIWWVQKTQSNSCSSWAVRGALCGQCNIRLYLSSCSSVITHYTKLLYWRPPPSNQRLLRPSDQWEAGKSASNVRLRDAPQHFPSVTVPFRTSSWTARTLWGDPSVLAVVTTEWSPGWRDTREPASTEIASVPSVTSYRRDRGSWQPR